MKEGFYAVHKENGEFFIGKVTQVAYTKLNFLKSAMKYKNSEVKYEDYDFYKLNADGTIERLEQK